MVKSENAKALADNTITDEKKRGIIFVNGNFIAEKNIATRNEILYINSNGY
jgi:hypothetical protein